MQTPPTMPTFLSPAPRNTSRGLRDQVSPTNILAPTKEVQRPGSTPTLRTRGPSSIGSRPPVPVLYDPTGLQSNPPSLNPIQSNPIQSNPINQSNQSSPIQSNQSNQSNSITLSNPLINPSATLSLPSHCHLPTAKQTSSHVSSVEEIQV